MNLFKGKDKLKTIAEEQELKNSIHRLSIQVDDLIKERDKLLGERKEFGSMQDMIDSLKKNVTREKDNIAKAKLDHKMAVEDIKHLTSITKEKDELRYERKVMEMEKEQANNLADVQAEYRDKLTSLLERESANLREMYTEVLNRLPNLDAHLKGKL